MMIVFTRILLTKFKTIQATRFLRYRFYCWLFYSNRSHNLYWVKEQLFNPFISLIEKNENPETALNKDHRMWKKEKRVLQISNKRLWLSIIHHKNKINKFDGYGNVNWSDLKNAFTLSNEVNTLLEQKLIPFSQWRFLSLKTFIQKFEINFKLFKRALGVYNS
jgi:hypothetical protein